MRSHNTSKPSYHIKTEKREENYAIVYERAGNSCEICGVRAENIHHRKPRGRGGAQNEGGPDNMMALCGSGTQGCHGWIESNREEAKVQGWLLGQYEDPAKVPLAYRGQWSWLTREGLVIPATGLETLALARPMRLEAGK